MRNKNLMYSVVVENMKYYSNIGHIQDTFWVIYTHSNKASLLDHFK